MDITYIGPKHCKKCGREVPEDRVCPRCESGPWWPVVLACLICGFGVGWIVYMEVRTRPHHISIPGVCNAGDSVEITGKDGKTEVWLCTTKQWKDVPVMAEVSESPTLVTPRLGSLFPCIQRDGSRLWTEGACPEWPKVKSKPSAAGEIQWNERNNTFGGSADFTWEPELFPVVVIKGHNKTTVLVPKFQTGVKP